MCWHRERYEIKAVEIGMEEDYMHYLVQGVPTMSVSRMVTIIKSVTAREIFKRHPNIKRDILLGGALWMSGYYANTVGQYASRETIAHYIQNQGNDIKKYKRIYEGQIELSLFDDARYAENRYSAACGGVVHFFCVLG